MLMSAFVTFFAVWILTRHIQPHTMRRLVAHKGKIDLLLHGSVIYLFAGSFDGLMQAECAAIMFSIYLFSYRRMWGYERRINGRWIRFPGLMTRSTQ